MPPNLRSRRRRRTAQRPPSAATVIALRAVLYVLLASGILMIGRAGRNVNFQWLLSGFAVFSAAAVLKSRLERRLRVLLEPRLRERLLTLLRKLQVSDERLFIRGSRGWLAPIATTAAGAGLLFGGFSQSAAGLMIAGGILLIALLMWLRRLPYLTKPVLVLSGPGFEAPPLGFIPWERALQISLNKVEVRGIHLHHELQILVYGSTKHLPGAKTPLQRFWRKLRRAMESNKVRVALRYTDEDPQMIVSLADMLWRRALGKDRVGAASQRVSFEMIGGEMIDAQAIARTLYEAALTTEHDLDVIRRAARAEPLDFDFSELDAAAPDHAQPKSELPAFRSRNGKTR